MDKEKKRKLIGNITKGISCFLGVVDIIKQAQKYNTRQNIQMSNQELTEYIKQGEDAVCAMIRSAFIYEKFIDMKGMKEESLEFMQEVLDEIVVMQEKGREKAGEKDGK